MWLVYVAIFVGLIFILDAILIDQRQFKLYKQFPSPPRLPIIGHGYIALFVKPKDFLNLLKKIRQKFPQKAIAGYLGDSLEVGIADYKIIEKIITDNRFLSKSSYYNFLGNILGDGLLFSTNQKWFNRRRIITPTFHFKILEQFFDVFQKQSGQLIGKLKMNCDGSVINVFPIISSCVLRSLCETAMGYEMQDQDNEYLNAVRKLNYQVANSFLSPWHRIKFIYNLTPTKKAKDKCANIMRKFTTKIIEERRNFLAQNDRQTLEHLDDDDVGLKKKMCLLDVLLLSTIDNEPLNNSEIQEEVDTFTFAGHDTTSNAICFTLYNISKYSEVQKKLNAEIEEILGHDHELEFKDLGKFKYLELVIKETLRLYPPVPIISRRLFEEVKFKEFIAPSNANYNLGLYDIFHNEENFYNSTEFIPERFLENLPPFSFIPFSAGPRNCIGQKFAMINIKTTVINILKNFELIDSNIEPRIELHVTMKCSKLFIGFKRRK